jgi:UDP-N-acetylmuramate dehydrogenase
MSTIGVGGCARWFARAERVEDVVAVHDWCARHETELFVLGGGSNLVIADEGFGGLVLQVGLRGVEVTRDGDETLMRAAAGESWETVVAAAVSAGLAGLECLSGIPGSVGGTPVQNVGAYGQEVSETIDTLTAYDCRTADVLRMSAGDCGFSYRNSRFRGEDAGRFVITDVTFRLRRGSATLTYPDVIQELSTMRLPRLVDVRQAVLAIRKRKGMVADVFDPDTRSVGSFFVNPIVSPAVYERVAASAGSGQMVPSFGQANGDVKIPAAWLIERAGFSKGYASGPVGISTKHPLALVNRGGAKARDVLQLASRIKRRVVDRFGIWLFPEPIFVGFINDPLVEYLRQPGHDGNEDG